MIDRKFFFDGVRKSLFGGSLSERQVKGMDAVFTEWDARGLGDLGQLAYMLTTIYHETDRTMWPIKEYGGASTRYAPYFGRGFVQLTWLKNYQKMQRLIGVPLVEQPDLALNLDYATTIMFEGMLGGLFTGRSVYDYDFATDRSVYNARAIINGDKDYPATDKRYKTIGEQLTAYFHAFLDALKVGGGDLMPADAAGAAVIVTEPDFSEHPKAQVPEVAVNTAEAMRRDHVEITHGITQGYDDPEFLAWKRDKQQAQQEQQWRERNSKPLVSSVVTKFVLMGISSFLAVRFGFEVPPEWQPLIETAIVSVMGAGAVWGRSRATTFINGVFK